MIKHVLEMPVYREVDVAVVGGKMEKEMYEVMEWWYS